MKSGIKLVCCALGLLSGLSVWAAGRPNIVMILADDIGFSDIGCYGSEIETPNLDRLAKNGLRFTQFYNMAKCNPTRSSLYTGLYLPRKHADNAVPFSSVLREAGYYTAMCGKEHFEKWTPKRCEAALAFEDSFIFPTCISYFPRPDTGEFEHPFRLNGKTVKAAEIEAEIKPLYKTDFITDYALRFLDKADDGDKPFFLYLPYHAAHYPLQARPADLAKYRGTYRKGWDVIRKKRLARLKKSGLLDENIKQSPAEPSPFTTKGKMEYRPWETLSADEQDAMDLEMAVYAAMVDRLDQNIGRVIARLEQMGVLDNTLILFFVDNGGCPYPNDRTQGIPPAGAESYYCLSPAWAHISNTPFRLYKRYGHEGGCRGPFIAHWPKTIKAGINRSPAHLVDLYPTLLELAGAKYPSTIEGRPTPSLDGTSLLPLFRGESRVQPDVILSGFRNSNPMMRCGDWKLVRMMGKPWELYNIAADPTELNDLAKKHPEKLQEMIAKLEAWKAQ